MHGTVRQSSAARQPPSTQVSPVAHSTPHPPQCLGCSRASTQVSAQSVRPSPQGAPASGSAASAGRFASVGRLASDAGPASRGPASMPLELGREPHATTMGAASASARPSFAIDPRSVIPSTSRAATAQMVGDEVGGVNAGVPHRALVLVGARRPRARTPLAGRARRGSRVDGRVLPVRGAVTVSAPGALGDAELAARRGARATSTSRKFSSACRSRSRSAHTLGRIGGRSQLSSIEADAASGCPRAPPSRSCRGDEVGVAPTRRRTLPRR